MDIKFEVTIQYGIMETEAVKEVTLQRRIKQAIEADLS